MADITRVVCPIDFSEFSKHALEHAVAIAHARQAPLTVLHVVPLQPLPVSQSEFDGYQTTPVLPPIELGSVTDAVRRFCTPVVGDGLVPDIVVRAGLPLADIVAEAGSRSDLLVLGTHGRGGFDRLFLGSIAERAIRKVPGPVLVVPPRSRRDDPAPVAYKTILCPVDFSPPSLRAVEAALALAKDSGGRLILLHVVEVQSDEALFGAATHYTVPEYFRYLRDDAHKRLDALIPHDARAWCTPELRVPSGTPYREVLRAAADAGADLIVMGVAGRAGFSTMMLGSTTNQVLRAATCPVLTVRS